MVNSGTIRLVSVGAWFQSLDFGSLPQEMVQCIFIVKFLTEWLDRTPNASAACKMLATYPIVLHTPYSLGGRLTQEGVPEPEGQVDLLVDDILSEDAETVVELKQ